MKKKKSLIIFDTGINTAEENMRLDEEMLFSLDPSGSPILHFYEWQNPSATYGYFLDPGDELDLDAVQKRGISLARRPTGGGIVFHIWDYAFSFLMPAEHPCCHSTPLENYHFVNRCVAEAVRPFLTGSSRLLDFSDGKASSFCMAKPTIYDVLVEGRKVAGAAQRRRKNGYLHQGTISLGFPDQALLEEILLRKEIIEAMKVYSFSPLGPCLEDLRLTAKKQLAMLFKRFCG